MIMMELFPPAAAGVGGSAFVVMIAWITIKSRLDAIEKTLESVVREKECIARTIALAQRVDNSVSRFNRVDASIEVVRELLLKRSDWQHDGGGRSDAK